MNLPSLSPEKERELVLRAKAGDRKAYGDLVFAHRERAMNGALSILQNYEDARDMTQEAFVRAFKALKRFDDRRPFYPWYYRILRNLCLSHLKRYGPARQLSLESLVEEDHVPILDDGSEDVREVLHREQMARHLRTAMDSLKPEFKEILAMKHFEDMSYQEISQALRIPIGTVMSRLFHARKALAKLMEKYR